MPLILEEECAESPLVIKDFAIDRYSLGDETLTYISSRTPEEKAIHSYLFMEALRKEGVPVPPVSELVTEDTHENLGIRKNTLLQTDIRKFGKIAELYEAPQIIYKGSDAGELLQGIAFDLAKMHSQGLTIYDDVLTPWVIIDDNSGRLQRMVLDTAALHHKSPNYGTECYGNFTLAARLLCRKEDTDSFYDAYCKNIDHEPLKREVEKALLSLREGRR